MTWISRRLFVQHEQRRSPRLSHRPRSLLLPREVGGIQIRVRERPSFKLHCLPCRSFCGATGWRLKSTLFQEVNEWCARASASDDLVDRDHARVRPESALTLSLSPMRPWIGHRDCRSHLNHVSHRLDCHPHSSLHPPMRPHLACWHSPEYIRLSNLPFQLLARRIGIKSPREFVGTECGSNLELFSGVRTTTTARTKDRNYMMPCNHHTHASNQLDDMKSLSLGVVVWLRRGPAGAND